MSTQSPRPDPTRREAVGRIVLAGAAIGICVAFTYYWKRDLTVAHHDAKAHLVVSRRVFDNIRPGWKQHGVVWLPLLHVLYMPFLANWWLYTTGLAASGVSAVAYVAAVYLLYHLGAMLTRTSWGGVVAAAPLAMHPGVVYLGVSPMTEVPFLALMIGSVYALCRWVASGRGLWLAAGLCAAAGLVRYSGWFLAAGETLVVLGVIWRRDGWAPAWRRALAFGVVAGMGAPLFALHTWYTTGSPWAMMQGIHGAAPDGGAIAGQHTMGALCRLGKTFTRSLGISPWVAVAVVGAFAVRWGWRGGPWSAAWTLGAPLVCIWASMVWGLPPRARYCTLLLPMLGVMAAAVVSVRHRWVGPIVAAVVVLAVGARDLYLENVPLREALWHREHLPHRDAALRFLRQHHDGRPILIAGGLAPEMYDLQIPLRRFITDTHMPLYRFVSHWHTRRVGWILIRRGDDLYRLYREHPDTLDGFVRVFTRGRWEVWMQGEPL